MSHKVELRTAPEVKRVMSIASPGYRKHFVYLHEFSAQNINSFWDGGSRSYFTLVDLATLRTRELPSRTHPFFEVSSQGMANQQNEAIAIDRAGNIVFKYIPEGIALVETGVFCGKIATARLYLHPNNMTKLLKMREGV